MQKALCGFLARVVNFLFAPFFSFSCLPYTFFSVVIVVHRQLGALPSDQFFGRLNFRTSHTFLHNQLKSIDTPFPMLGACVMGAMLTSTGITEATICCKWTIIRQPLNYFTFSRHFSASLFTFGSSIFKWASSGISALPLCRTFHSPRRLLSLVGIISFDDGWCASIVSAEITKCFVATHPPTSTFRSNFTYNFSACFSFSFSPPRLFCA